MPLHKVEVLLGHRIESTLQSESIGNIPNAEEVVHATSDKPFASRIKFAILKRLCVAGELNNLRGLEILDRRVSL